MRINALFTGRDEQMLTEISDKLLQDIGIETLRYCVRSTYKALIEGKGATDINVAKIIPTIPQKKLVPNYPKTCDKHGGNWMSCGCDPKDSYELIN